MIDYTRDGKRGFTRVKFMAPTTLVVVVLVACSALPSDDADRATPSAAQARAESETAVSDVIPYQTVRRWSVPAGGTGQSIFIDPKYANEADLRRLGEQLRHESPNDPFAFVFIFDTERAARLQGTFDNSDDDHEHYMRHTVGQYTRNGSSGYHRFHGSPEGIMGQAFDIDY